MMVILTRVIGVILLLLALWLIAVDCGDWAARIGSTIVALSLLSAFWRTHSEVADPNDGPLVMDGGGAEPYAASAADKNAYRRKVNLLVWEFFGAIIGTLVNGYGGWIAALVAR